MRIRSTRQYKSYLERLHYHEYAGSDEQRSVANTSLNLSLWNDVAPGDLQDAAYKAARLAGTYHFSQDIELIGLLSNRLGYSQGQISVVAGADDALRIAARYCVRPGSKVLIPVPSFGRYEYHAFINEAAVEYVHFDEFPHTFDVSKIVHCAKKKKATCIILGNPNNPTGSALSISEVDYLVSSTPAMIILDESLLVGSGLSPHAGIARKYDNLLICGSFSKLYGLAGLRVGYLIVSEYHRGAISAHISPFEVDSVAIELAKYVLKNETALANRVNDFHEGIQAVRNLYHPDIRISHTAAPVALIELATTRRKLYNFLYGHGIVTVDANEFSGLEKINGVRIIVRNKDDISTLQKVLQRM